MKLPAVSIIQITPVELMGHTWLCVGFEEEGVHMGDAMHLAFIYKNDYIPGKNLNSDISKILSNSCPLVRIHSECLLGDALHSDLCDCGEQLRSGLRTIIENGAGIILYLRQEGRGIGMRAKLACLAAQEGYIDGKKSIPSMSPDEANIYHGFDVDERNYAIVPSILKLLKQKEVIMMTGNIDKVNAVSTGGIKVRSLTDIDRSHIKEGSRKYRELSEKAKRNYRYELTGA
jgi:GTP cyclohydrolase II